jgi:hypothetical protein
VTTFVPCPDQDLEAGLGLSRLSRDDFLRFLQLAAFFTSYTRLKHVSLVINVLAACALHDVKQPGSKPW